MIIIKYTGAKSIGSNPVYSTKVVSELSKLINFEVLTISPELFVNNKNINIKYMDKDENQNIINKFFDIQKQWLWMNRTYNKSDIVIAINPFEAIPFARFNQIIVIHDLIPLIFPKKYPFTYIYYSIILPLVLKSSKHIITVSENTKKDIMRFYRIPDSKITVVYNGAGNSFDESNHFVRKKIREIKSIYILYVGGQSYHKNILRLLQAFKLLNEKCEIKLVFVGSPHWRTYKDISNFCKTNCLDDKIIFLGTVSESELACLYKNAKLLVFPSLYEGFGLPPLEAMSNLLPVVASNVSSIPEICGNAVYYVNPYDPVAIANGIYEIIINNSLRNELIQKGLDRVKIFSWESTAKGYLKVIEEIQKNIAISNEKDSS